MARYIYIRSEGARRLMTPEEEATFEAALPVETPLVPPVISDRQFFQALAEMGFITLAEALAAVKTGEIPVEFQALIASLPSEEDRFAAEMLMSGATQFNRSHPLTLAFGASKGWTSEDIDELFVLAASM
jgi:hypothetical protein